MRISKRLLPHKISFRPYTGEGPRGATYGPLTLVNRAYVEDKSQLVINKDGVEERSGSFVVVDPHWDIPVESLVTIWEGTPRERESRLISNALKDHPETPSHLQLYLA